MTLENQTDAMNETEDGVFLPRTFQITLKKPFGHFTTQVYYFYLHAETHEEALQWVERVFPGIETTSLRQRWAEPQRPLLRPLLRDRIDAAVSIVNVDAMNKGRDGRWRKTTTKVKERLEIIFERLAEEQRNMVNRYPQHVRQYECYPSAYYFNRLVDIRQYVANIQRWRNALWSVLHEMASNELVLPLPERSAQERDGPLR